MKEAFQRSHRTGPETGPLHYRGVHSLDAVQLPLCAATGIEETGLLKKADRDFDRHDSRTSLLENRIAGGEGVGKARRLAPGHWAPAGTAVCQKKGMRTGQLRRRSLACW
jgi:hypothetical protein